MGKLTWKFLGEIFEGQFKITPTEAADVLYKYLFTDTSWKGRLDKKTDQIIKNKLNIEG